jgi:hypothetical protein
VGHAANPVKLYEYLALGKPVVTTPLADLDEFGGLVSAGESAQEITPLLRQGVSEAGSSLCEDRLALARDCSWRHRPDALLEFIDEFAVSAASARRQ